MSCNLAKQTSSEDFILIMCTHFTVAILMLLVVKDGLVKWWCFPKTCAGTIAQWFSVGPILEKEEPCAGMLVWHLCCVCCKCLDLIAP